MVRLYRNYQDPLQISNSNLGSSGCRTVFRIPKGVNVNPKSIRIVNLSFNCDAAGNKFNGTYGVYEPITYVQIRTASGDEISECRNVAELMQLLNVCGITNDYLDCVYSLESGVCCSMSIDSATQNQSFRRSMGNRLYVNKGNYKLEFTKMLPVLNSLPDVMDCGFEIIIEWGSTFANAPNTTLASCVLQYDELLDYKHTNTAQKIVHTEWLPERLYFNKPAANAGFNTQSIRFLSFTGRTVDRLLMNVQDAETGYPVILEDYNGQAANYNWFFNGQQYIPLSGLTSNQFQLKKFTDYMGKVVFPYNHLYVQAPALIRAIDDPSVQDVLPTPDPGEGDGETSFAGILSPIALSLGGLKIQELQFQITAYQDDTQTTQPDCYVFLWGEVLKTLSISSDGNVLSEFV
jgi:hypothetical protein